MFDQRSLSWMHIFLQERYDLVCDMSDMSDMSPSFVNTPPTVERQRQRLPEIYTSNFIMLSSTKYAKALTRHPVCCLSFVCDLFYWIPRTQSGQNSSKESGRKGTVDRLQAERDWALHVGTLTCLGRLVNALAGALGPELNKEAPRLMQFWAIWDTLRAHGSGRLADGTGLSQPMPTVLGECVQFIELLALFCPSELIAHFDPALELLKDILLGAVPIGGYSPCPLADSPTLSPGNRRALRRSAVTVLRRVAERCRSRVTAGGWIDFMLRVVEAEHAVGGQGQCAPSTPSDGAAIARCRFSEPWQRKAVVAGSGALGGRGRQCIGVGFLDVHRATCVNDVDGVVGGARNVLQVLLRHHTQDANGPAALSDAEQSAVEVRYWLKTARTLVLNLVARGGKRRSSSMSSGRGSFDEDGTNDGDTKEGESKSDGKGGDAVSGSGGSGGEGKDGGTKSGGAAVPPALAVVDEGNLIEDWLPALGEARWQTKALAVECLRRAMDQLLSGFRNECARAAAAAQETKAESAGGSHAGGEYLSHFDLRAATAAPQVGGRSGGRKSPKYLVQCLSDVVTLCCHLATSSLGGLALTHLRYQGIALLSDVIMCFGSFEDPEGYTEEGGEPEALLTLYRSQIMGALKCSFNDKPVPLPTLTAHACGAAASLVTLSIIRDAPAIRRIVGWLNADIHESGISDGGGSRGGNAGDEEKGAGGQDVVAPTPVVGPFVDAQLRLARLAALARLQLSITDEVDASGVTWNVGISAERVAPIARDQKNSIAAANRPIALTKAAKKTIATVLGKSRNELRAAWLGMVRDHGALSLPAAAGRHHATSTYRSTSDGQRFQPFLAEWWSTLACAATVVIDSTPTETKEDAAALDVDRIMLLTSCLRCVEQPVVDMKNGVYGASAVERATQSRLAALWVLRRLMHGDAPRGDSTTSGGAVAAARECETLRWLTLPLVTSLLRAIGDVVGHAAETSSSGSADASNHAAMLSALDLLKYVVVENTHAAVFIRRALLHGTAQVSEAEALYHTLAEACTRPLRFLAGLDPATLSTVVSSGPSAAAATNAPTAAAGTAPGNSRTVTVLDGQRVAYTASLLRLCAKLAELCPPTMRRAYLPALLTLSTTLPKAIVVETPQQRQGLLAAQHTFIAGVLRGAVSVGETEGQNASFEGGRSGSWLKEWAVFLHATIENILAHTLAACRRISAAPVEETARPGTPSHQSPPILNFLVPVLVARSQLARRMGSAEGALGGQAEDGMEGKGGNSSEEHVNDLPTMHASVAETLVAALEAGASSAGEEAADTRIPGEAWLIREAAVAALRLVAASASSNASEADGQSLGDLSAAGYLQAAGPAVLVVFKEVRNVCGVIC